MRMLSLPFYVRGVRVERGRGSKCKGGGGVEEARGGTI